MELSGAIEALSQLQGTRGPVSIYTDSTYVIQGIGGWVHGWKRRGWKTAAGTGVLNRGLWEQLDALASARGPPIPYRFSISPTTLPFLLAGSSRRARTDPLPLPTLTSASSTASQCA